MPATTEPRDQPIVHPAAFPIARFDLEEEVRRMRASHTRNGHLGKTLLRAADIRIVLVTLHAGAQIPPHHTDGSLTIQALDGRVIVSVLESTYDLGPGQLLSIEREVPYGLAAVDDSAILLTIAWRGTRSQAPE
jgi:quercetin dioxygenase-like cupin family protein